MTLSRPVLRLFCPQLLEEPAYGISKPILIVYREISSLFRIFFSIMDPFVEPVGWTNNSLYWSGHLSLA